MTITIPQSRVLHGGKTDTTVVCESAIEREKRGEGEEDKSRSLGSLM